MIARGLQVALTAFVGVREQEPRIVAQRREEFLQRPREADLPLDLLHFGVDALDLGEAERVDLVGGHGGRGARGQALDVVLRPVGQLPNARGDLVAIRAIGLCPRDQLRVRRPDVFRQRRGGRRTQLFCARSVDLAGRKER